MKDIFADGGLKKILEGDPKLKSYYCPYCKEMIMRGNVIKLSMVCPNCRKLIKADADELTEK